MSDESDAAPPEVAAPGAVPKSQAPGRWSRRFPPWAALASPAAHAPPTGPSYAHLGDACRLVAASTLARYAAGAGAGQSGGVAGPGVLGQSSQSRCSWFPSTGDLDLTVTTYSSIDYAQAGLQFGVKFARQLPSQTVKGTQQVRGLGEQATAIIAVEAGSPKVELLVRSGNAVIDVSYGDPPFPPELSQAGKLAADSAVTRDVLARLHRA